MTLLPFQISEFPEEFQDDFDCVISQSTKYESQLPQHEGSIEATMRRIRNSAGEKIGERIFRIYSRFRISAGSRTGVILTPIIKSFAEAGREAKYSRSLATAISGICYFSAS